MPTLPHFIIGEYHFDPNRNVLVHRAAPSAPAAQGPDPAATGRRGRRRLDGTGTARRHTGEIALEPLAAEVLAYLARHAGEVVSKEELIANVWRGSVVSDGPLYRVVASLRSVLGDDRAAPSYIQTISKRGYRLVADVVQTPAAPAAGGPLARQAPAAATGRAAVAARGWASRATDPHGMADDGETDLTLTQVGHTSISICWRDERGDELRREFRHAFTVGRGRRCEVRLPDASVSRAHTRISCRSGQWMVTDLDSTNGTEVDGRRVSEVVLTPGVHTLRVSPTAPELHLIVTPLA